MHKDKYCRQINGVTMGSPLGPTLANFYPAYFERKLLTGFIPILEHEILGLSKTFQDIFPGLSRTYQ